MQQKCYKVPFLKVQCYFLKNLVQGLKSKFQIPIKGQLISKCLFGIFNFPKKRTKKFDFTTMVSQVCFRSFFGRIEDTKKKISKLTDI